MRKSNQSPTTRRQIVTAAGQGLALLPLAGILTACGGGEQSAPPAPAPKAPAAPPPVAAQPAPAAPPASPPPASAPAAAPPAQPAMAGASMPRQTEDDPAAMALGYKHDATQIDAGKYANYAAGQVCANCFLYAGAPGSEWGACSIFGGKQVNAKGWCQTYQPKPNA
jgi:hypothetical protein